MREILSWLGHAGRRERVPVFIVTALVFSWALAAVWLVPRYPFLTGTDETVKYVAFSAARNRWPSDDEIRRYGVSTAFHPPLYPLAFAPFWGDEPLFTDGFPSFTNVNTFRSGGYRYLFPEFDPVKHAVLDNLYRAAKYFSLALGVVTLLAVAATVRLAIPQAGGWWACLLALIPLVGLPQFLYYQTLANNDALCTALGALTVMCFAGACAALARGDERAHLRWAAGLALFAGLNLLTKTTALALLPLLPVTALGALFTRRGSSRDRLLRFGKILVLVVAVTAASGGWWIVRGAARGDWTGQELHRSLHPWAFTDRPYWERRGWVNFLLATARSYVGLMAGPYWGVTDAEFIAYGILPLSTVALGASLLVRKALQRRVNGTPGAQTPVAWLQVGGFLVAVASNFLAFLWLNREVTAPFGHFFFLSLAASHGLAALIWWAALRRRKQILVALVAAVGVLYGTAFLHAFRTWMLRAVEQPPERIVSLAAPPALLLEDPIEGHAYRQPFVLPPGRVGGVRVKLAVTQAWPQLGGSVEGFLELAQSRGGTRRVPLKPLALGDAGWSDRYVEFEPQQEIAAAQERMAALTLMPRGPWFPKNSAVRLLDCGAQADPRIGDLERDGIPLGGRNLCLAIAYRD